jgi:hypothetical protein
MIEMYDCTTGPKKASGIETYDCITVSQKGKRFGIVSVRNLELIASLPIQTETVPAVHFS